jgi:hypothetical protein
MAADTGGRRPLRRRGALFQRGRPVQLFRPDLTDGKNTYFRAPARSDNQPLYRIFLTPGSFDFHDHRGVEFYDQAEPGHFLSYTAFPVSRARAYRPRSPAYADNRLHDLAADYPQANDLCGGEREESDRELLVSTMKRMDAPTWQCERLGLKADRREAAKP